MILFGCDQSIFTIGNVKIGGQPGELPTVLIGSIFHRGHKIVKDHVKGIFNKKRAERLILDQEDMSEKTGNPCMVDVVAESGDALNKYIDFVSNCTEAPLLINGTESSVRLQGLQYAYEIGLKERSVYTSINYTVTKTEIERLKELKAEATIIQAFNPQNPLHPEGMYRKLYGESKEKGLIELVRDAGIKKNLILASVLDVPSIGITCGAISLIKERLGLPSGAAPLGVFSQWRGNTILGENVKTLGRAAAAAIIQDSGGDFIIYGSIAKAKTVFPSCAVVDAILGYASKNSGISLINTDTHPLFKIG